MHTFYEAAVSYLEHGGEERYIKPLIEKFGEHDVTTITPMRVRAAALEIFPGS